MLSLVMSLGAVDEEFRSRSDFVVTDIDVAPQYPIVRGTPFSIITSGVASRELKRVQARVTVKIAGVPVYR